MTPALVALDSALSRFGWIRTVSAIAVTIPCVRPACAGVTRAWRNWKYAPGLGPGGRKAVGVRVPPPAPDASRPARRRTGVNHGGAGLPVEFVDPHQPCAFALGSLEQVIAEPACEHEQLALGIRPRQHLAVAQELAQCLGRGVAVPLA